jgi:multiple sugar transport system ATP-binding protein
MADRVAIIKAGILQQVAPPQELFDNPDNLFVGAFIGSPSMNLLEAKLIQDDGEVRLQLGPSVTLGTQRDLFAGRESLRRYTDGRRVVVGIRPTDFHDASVHTEIPSNQRIRTEASHVEMLGHERMVYFRLDGHRVIPDESLVDEDMEEEGDDRGVTITARFESTEPLSIGDRIEVGVDVAKAHFFDPESGLVIRD